MTQHIAPAPIQASTTPALEHAYPDRYENIREYLHNLKPNDGSANPTATQPIYPAPSTWDKYRNEKMLRAEKIQMHKATENSNLESAIQTMKEKFNLSKNEKIRLRASKFSNPKPTIKESIQPKNERIQQAREKSHNEKMRLRHKFSDPKPVMDKEKSLPPIKLEKRKRTNSESSLFDLPSSTTNQGHVNVEPFSTYHSIPICQTKAGNLRFAPNPPPHSENTFPGLSSHGNDTPTSTPGQENPSVQSKEDDCLDPFVKGNISPNPLLPTTEDPLLKLTHPFTPIRNWLLNYRDFSSPTPASTPYPASYPAPYPPSPSSSPPKKLNWAKASSPTIITHLEISTITRREDENVLLVLYLAKSILQGLELGKREKVIDRLMEGLGSLVDLFMSDDFE